MSDNFSILTDTERAVVETITMRMHTDEALAYLKDCGITMVKRSNYRHKKKVEAIKWQRLIHAANLLTHQHLQRMDRLELVEKLMWTEYEKEKSAYRRVAILQALVAMQPYISGYYDATTYVLSKRLRTDVTAKPQLGYLEQDKFNAKLKEKREQNLSRDQKLTNQEFDEQEQKERNKKYESQLNYNMLDMQSEPFVIGGQKIVNVNISNDAVIFLKECVNGFIDGKYGDADDPRQKKVGQELKEDLHKVWKALNPS